MIKRPLVICTILFLTGILCSLYNLMWLPVLLLIGPVLLARFIGTGKAGLFYIAVIFLLLGTVRMEFAEYEKRKITATFTGEFRNLHLVITEPSKDGRATAFFKANGKKVYVYLSVKDNPILSCGDMVKGDITLFLPDDTVSSYSHVNYLASRRIYLQASADSVLPTGKYDKGITGAFFSFRRYVSSIGKSFFNGNSRALFNAMVTGDKSLLSGTLYNALQGSGLNHIAVVSGMHLSVIINFITFLFIKAFGRGPMGFILAILCSIAVTLVTGAGASVVRALLMCSLFYISHLLCRESDALTNLFCSVMIMLIFNPYIIFNVGFVLSVFSVLGIILYSEKFSEFLKLLVPRPAATALAATFAAQLTVTPIVAYYFNVATFYAPLSNILAVPLSSLYVVVGILLTAFSSVRGVSAVLTLIMNFIASGIENICCWVSALPYAMIDCGSSTLFTLLWVILAATVFRRIKGGDNL